MCLKKHTLTTVKNQISVLIIQNSKLYTDVETLFFSICFEPCMLFFKSSIMVSDSTMDLKSCGKPRNNLDFINNFFLNFREPEIQNHFLCQYGWIAVMFLSTSITC